MMKRIFLTILRAHGPVLSPLANLHPPFYTLHSYKIHLYNQFRTANLHPALYILYSRKYIVSKN
jgi:hypothetical protein